MIQLLLESTIVWGPCIQHVLLSGGVSHTDNSRWILPSLPLCDKTSLKKNATEMRNRFICFTITSNSLWHGGTACFFPATQN